MSALDESSESPTAGPTRALPSLWGDTAPRHFDTHIPVWFKIMAVVVAVIVSILSLDKPIAQFARDHAAFIPDLGRRVTSKGYSDVAREMMLLEQWGQGVCSVVVVFAVGMLDRQGRRRALAIALGCIITVLITHLLKDLFGRSRPFVFSEDGAWSWGGPKMGFTHGSAWGSFPSAHTTGAFALAAGLSWCYPRGRGLFMSLAIITAMLRVLHTAHYLSDTLAGMGVGVMVMRATLGAKLAGGWIALSPRLLRDWWLQDNR